MAVAAALATGAALLATATPAHAAGPVIAVTGSDTTQDVMQAILAGTGAYNVRAIQSTPLTVPSDANCSDDVHLPHACRRR